MPAICPITTIFLRNSWETYNVNSGKAFGGYDRYNVRNIPSCNERSQNHMNFLDSTNPWARTMVKERGDEWAVDSHGGDWARVHSFQK